MSLLLKSIWDWFHPPKAVVPYVWLRVDTHKKHISAQGKGKERKKKARNILQKSDPFGSQRLHTHMHACVHAHNLEVAHFIGSHPFSPTESHGLMQIQKRTIYKRKRKGTPERLNQSFLALLTDHNPQSNLIDSTFSSSSFISSESQIL